MVDANELSVLDPQYFSIIFTDAFDVTIMSRNTRHFWFIHNPEYPTPGTCIIFHKHKMAHMQDLIFNNENIPMPASYSVSLSDVEADSGGVTEAGTTQRDVVREGVVQIGVTFRVSKRWLNKFSAYKKLARITVRYLDMETMNIVDTQMYIDGYQVKLVSDTSYGSLWEVSFVLKGFLDFATSFNISDI